jgi:hypothetical protein
MLRTDIGRTRWFDVTILVLDGVVVVFLVWFAVGDGQQVDDACGEHHMGHYVVHAVAGPCIRPDDFGEDVFGVGIGGVGQQFSIAGPDLVGPRVGADGLTTFVVEHRDRPVTVQVPCQQPTLRDVMEQDVPQYVVVVTQKVDQFLPQRGDGRIVR